MNLSRKAVLCVEGIDELGGIARFVQNFALELKNGGWETHVLATTFKGTYFNSMNTMVRCHDLSTMKLSPSKVARVAELLNEIDPEVILLNHCSLAHYALPLLKESIKPVAVVHSDDVRFYEVASQFARRIFRWVVPARGMIDRFKEFLPQEFRMRIERIPHGVRQDIFTLTPSPKTSAGMMVSFVGYLETNKGAHLLPNIFAQIHGSFPDAHFTIVGDGPLRTAVETEVRGRNLQSLCTFTGPLSQPEVAHVLRQTQVFVLPTEVESFGLAVAEAMLCGAVPVVTHLKGILDDLVDDGQTGLLVNDRTASAFARAIISLLQYPDRLSAMSRQAADKGIRMFSLSTMMKKYERIFEGRDERMNIPVRGRTGWYMEVIGDFLARSDARGINYRRLRRILRRQLQRTLGEHSMNL